VRRPSVVYSPRPDATPERELSALAAAYKFILDRRTEKGATRPGDPDDAKGSKHDRATVSVHE
jgi:hypothetical protein